MTALISAHPLTIRLLSIMLIASFILGLLGATGPGLVRAENICWWSYQYSTYTCQGGICVWPAGTNYLRWTYHYRSYCCNAYDYCWWTNQWKTEPGPAGCTWC